MSIDPYTAPQSDLEAELAVALATPKRHSRMGIASFVLALLCGAALFGMLGYVVYREFAAPGSMEQNVPLVMLVGFVVILAGVGNVLGIVLGIAGLVQARHKRLFAALGLGLNVLLALVFVAMIVFGSMQP